MHRRRSVFLCAAGIVIALTAATRGWAQNTLPQLSEEEIQKMTQALPAKATAKPAKPRKVLLSWRCEGFFHGDEMYQMKEPYSRETLRVLLSFDMSKLPADAPTRADKDNPIAWIQQVGKGREFYCSLGHNRHIFWDPAILQFYLDGIQYALGDLPADATPSARLRPAPEPMLAPNK